MTDLSTPRFSGAQVAKGCHLAVTTFRSNFARGHFRVIGDARERDSNGFPHQFSLRDATGFAVACGLMNVAKIHPKRAFEIGVVYFAHTGRGKREPGHVFNYRQFGETLLLFYPFSDKFRISSTDYINFDSLEVGSQGAQAVCILKLNRLVAGMFGELGLDPREGFEGSPPVDDPSNPEVGKWVSE